MFFDVFSRNDDIHGVLVCQCKNQLVYMNDKVVMKNDLEANAVKDIPPGTSYELVSNDEIQQINFESAPGLADGTTTESILRMLIHREETMIGNDGLRDIHLLAIRSMQLALDALQEISRAI